MRDEATATMKPNPTMVALVVANYGYNVLGGIDAMMRMRSNVY